jgi:hypothetical protein
MKTSFNKYIYIGFILLGFFLFLIKNSVGDAMTYFGIALAFDPFDQNQPWKERPKWQKAVLIVHLAFVLCLFGYMIGNTASDVKRGFMDGINGK